MDFDRLMKRRRGNILLLASLSFFPALGLHLWMWKVFIDAAPWWAVAIAFVTEMSVLLGLGSLLDYRRELDP